MFDFLLPFFVEKEDLSLPKHDKYVFVNANSIIFVECHKGGKKSCNYFSNAFYQASTFNLILCHIDKRASKFPPVIVKLKITPPIYFDKLGAKSAVFYTRFRMCKNNETLCFAA